MFREHSPVNLQFEFGARDGRTVVALEAEVQGLFFAGPRCAQTDMPFYISQVHHFFPFQIGLVTTSASLPISPQQRGVGMF